MRRIVLGLSIVTLSVFLCAPAHAEGPRTWPGFQVGIGAELPLNDLLGGGLAPTAEVRFKFGRGFVLADFAYTVTSLEEKGNESIDAGHDFTIAIKGGYNLVGTPQTHLGLGGGFGVHGVGPVGSDVGAAISIQAGVFPEAFITDGFAITGFIGMAFEFYTGDATPIALGNANLANRSLFRFSVGQGSPLLTMGMMYYF